MNGVYVNIEPQAITFVATDAHKLVKYAASAETGTTASFILPKKPANLLRGVLGKEDADIRMEFDDKNVVFHLKNHTLVCRLIEGNYPNHNAVIPANNPNKVLVDRTELLNGIRRVAVCSNQATNLIKFEIEPNTINLTAQDLDFSVSAQESLTCDYEVEGMTASAPGFYAPQGRYLRLAPADRRLNEKIESFEYGGHRFTNFEMEGSALAGLSRLMGHDAVTICTVIAQRVALESDTDYRPFVDKMIATCLEKLAGI